MQVTDWPFVAIGIRVPELYSSLSRELEYGELHDLLWMDEVGRWPSILGYFTKCWTEVQRQRNYPQEVSVANPREADLSPTPAPAVWGNDLITGEEFTAYPALYKQVGHREEWSFRWHESAEAAAAADAEARREAESYITARRLETALTAEAVAVSLPVELPAVFVPFTPPLASVMEQLGVSAEQFRIEDEGPLSVCVSRESGYYSEFQDRYVVLERARYADHWWRREGDLIVVFANATIRHLIGDGSDLGAAGQFGTAKEKIQAVRDWFAAERLKAEGNYRAQVREFVRSLQSQPAYVSLSSDVKAELVKLADSWGVSDPSRITDALLTEWAKAEVLHAKVETGEILTNFGGHFRVMGKTANAQFWVIRPDGSERLPDEVKYRKRYTSEGEKWWRLVGAEELAISWSKAFTAADHEFVVNKLPAGYCTPEQLAAVARLQCEIADRWNGLVGISGATSPAPVGWNLFPKEVPKPAAVPVAEGGERVSSDALKALRDHFNR